MFFRVNLPDDLRAARGKLELTQVALAHRLGVTPRTVQGWESGANMPQAKHRRLIAAFLDETLDEVAA